MTTISGRLESRRRLLRFLAGSPLLAGIGVPAWLAEGGSAQEREEPSKKPRLLLESYGEQPIAKLKDTVSVFDFEVVARKNLPPAHYGYLATGVDDDKTLAANRDALLRIEIKSQDRSRPSPAGRWS